MNALLRRPGKVLLVYWAVTLALAVSLVVPRSGVAPKVHAVTLLTGQVVRLDTADTTLQAPGIDVSRSPSFGTLAIPAAAEKAAGVFFDMHLFEVRYLEQSGFGDDRTTKVPVLISFKNRADALAAQRVVVIEGGIHITHVFEYLPLASGYVNKTGPFVPASGHDDAGVIDAGRTAAQASGMPDGTGLGDAAGVTGLYLDDNVNLVGSGVDSSSTTIGPSLDSALKIIGADVARQHGLNGNGVTIAVVDTGIDGTHPDLKGRVIAEKDFSTDGDTVDHFGHGTHVASIAAGTGAASDGKYGGVAPRAMLVNAKALNRNGGGTEGGIIRAMEWAADSGAKVINMSLGGGQSEGNDPMSRAVNAITEKKGVIFAIAAGNSGPRNKVSTPAAADDSLAVGAIDKSMNLASFSSRGPRLKNMALKPDIVAPGVAITAARANYGSGDPYATFSGTSMASPMVAGSAALVWQLHPEWTWSMVKNALQSSASPIGQKCDVSAFDQGSGSVNLAAIVDQKIVVDPGSISFGIIASGSAKQSVRLMNISGQPKTVSLQASLCSPNSSDGRVVVTPATMTIGSGESAPVTVTLDGFKASGQYSGNIQVMENSKPDATAAFGVVVK